MLKFKDFWEKIAYFKPFSETILLLLMVILVGDSVLAWNNNTFNNSLSEENITFIDNENHTRYLEIPDGITVTDAYMNLSGFDKINISFNYDWGFNTSGGNDDVSGIYCDNTYCYITDYMDGAVYRYYQNGTFLELNFSTTGDNDNPRGITSNGTYFWIVQYNLGFFKYWINGTYTGDWINTTDVANSYYPHGITHNSTNLFVVDAAYDSVYIYDIDDGSFTGNNFSTVNQGISADNEGIFYSEASKRIYIADSNEEKWYEHYLNGSYTGRNDSFISATYSQISLTGNLTDLIIAGRLGISTTNDVNIYDFTNTYNITNPYISINNTQVWNYSGKFYQENNRTDNLASYLNDYLAVCSLIGDNCHVPFLFHSDTMGILEYSDLEFSNEEFLENSQTYNSSTYETSSESFILNITYDSSEWTSATGKLFYNGTSYAGTRTGTEDDLTFSKQIDIPLLPGSSSQNRSFYWEISLFNSTSSYKFNSTEYNQTVEPIILVECNATYSTKAINFTAWNEGNGSQIKPFSFSGYFEYWLGEGDIIKNYSLDTKDNETHICISPSDNFTVDATIEYDEASGTSYVKRNYYFDNKIINSDREDIELRLLESTDSTTFIQEVLENQQPIEDAYIYTYKYYPGEAEYKLVQITKTGEDGKTVGFYEAETALYKHEIYVNNILEYEETEGRKMIPEDTPYTITFDIGDAVDEPWEDYDDLADLTKSLSFDNDTEIVTFTYEDSNSSFSQGRLIVYKEKYWEDDEIICNTTSALESASLTFNLSNQTRGNFIAEGYITRDSEELLVDSIRFSIDSGRDIFGNFGLFIGFFIILTAAMAFIFHPIVGIIAIDIALIFVNLIGFINFGGTFLFGILAVSVIAIWLMKD
ncbi:hypothetical protein GF386_04075 [Candidatus Pacearchaeota archaeon]|nr:hypothetical protein [Candidatus Pacearchaeota archaeon]